MFQAVVYIGNLQWLRTYNNIFLYETIQHYMVGLLSELLLVFLLSLDALQRRPES